MHLLEVMTHVIHQGEAKHGAVGAGDEERLRRGAGCDQTGRCVAREIRDLGLRSLNQGRFQIHALGFHFLVMRIAGHGVARLHTVADVNHVGGQGVLKGTSSRTMPMNVAM